MLTVVNLKEITLQSIQEGKAYKGKGSVAFESFEEAQEWANNHSQGIGRIYSSLPMP